MRSENTQCTVPVEAVSENVLEYQIRYQLELAQKILTSSNVSQSDGCPAARLLTVF